MSSADKPTETAPAAVSAPGVVHVALVALACLAVAMGVGRFAYTPLLPLMRDAGQIDLALASHLAVANYAGYLMGALACMAVNPRPALAARIGLVVVVAGTLAMAWTQQPAAWWFWRWANGVASAMVLVGVSGWSLAHMASQPHGARATGLSYSGVGVGITAVGLGVLVMSRQALPPQQQWQALGWVSLALVALCWTSLRDEEKASPAPPGAAQRPPGAASWRAQLPLVAAYGAAGFGYIVPATFLPAAARELLADARLFGWIWPVFGLAAALSTVAVAVLLAALPARRVWLWAQALLGLGVLLPLLGTGLAPLAASAVCVGGTFMVVTMAGMRVARELSAGQGTRLMAAMTAAFAAGQALGPLALPVRASLAEAMVIPSILAAALLWAGCAVLALGDRLRP